MFGLISTNQQCNGLHKGGGGGQQQQTQTLPVTSGEVKAAAVHCDFPTAMWACLIRFIIF